MALRILGQQLQICKQLTWRTKRHTVFEGLKTKRYCSGGPKNDHSWNRRTIGCLSTKPGLLERNKEIVLSTVLSRKTFHTSQRTQFHPVFWLIAKPLAKVASIISGRTFRKWWQKLSEAEKIKFKTKVGQSKGKIAAAVALLISLGIFNYYSHVQETPVTHRKRYLAFTEEQFLKIAKFELEMQWAQLRDNIVDPNDPKAKKIYDLIAHVAQNIVNSNQDFDLMRKQRWNVVVVDNDEPNAFVLPTGQIFVFTGILKLTENEDQLAVVLGHEIAHVLLSHGAEKISFAGLLDVFVIVLMAAMWAFIPSDGIALVTQWFYNKVIHLLLELPYSRKLETEADEVGLQLMAKACYDVRESSTFWTKMALGEDLQFMEDGNHMPEWLSTHPASESRASILDELIPKALNIRECQRCPRLVKVDPRLTPQIIRSMLWTAYKSTQEASEESDVESEESSQMGVVLPPDKEQ